MRRGGGGGANKVLPIRMGGGGQKKVLWRLEVLAILKGGRHPLKGGRKRFYPVLMVGWRKKLRTRDFPIL